MTTWAVDIGGTKIAAARVLDDGTIDGSPLVVQTPGSSGSDAVLAQVVQVLGRLDPSGVERIGISSAGVIDSAAGTVAGSTDSIRGWTGTHLAAHVSERFGHPATAVGDGHAFAVGESVYGKAAGYEAVLVVAIGTGVGGSFVRRGVPMQGSHWAGGHFGHILVPQAAGLPCYCGRTGHLEAIGSGAGMLRWYHQNGGAPTVTSGKVLVARVDDDATAAAAVTISAGAVGGAAAGLANAFDPDAVVIAGGVSQAGPSWENPMRAAFEAALIPALEDMPLIVSEAEDWLALRGAAHYARERMEQG